MTRGGDRPAALLQAMRAANRLHAQLRLDLTGPVDVYGVIAAQDIWLAFQPLGQLYGMYLQSDGAAGILVNADHPQSLQRFTAAHELGHHVMQHHLSLDDASRAGTLNRARGSQELIEQQAQVFAAYFLMPLKLVNHVLAQLNLDPSRLPLGSREVYRVSLALGTSYEATAWHLAELGKIRRTQVQSLLATTPVSIKTVLRGSKTTGPARSDVWWLDEQAANQTYQPRVNDEVVLDLPETPTSGYRWVLQTPPLDTAGDSAGSPLALELDRYDQVPSATPGRVGGTGRRHLVFRVQAQGGYALTLVRERPWVPGAPSGQFEVQLQVARPPTGDVRTGFYAPQRPLIAYA